MNFMDQALNVSVSPLQLLLALAFQVWLVVFPIIIIRKLNYLTAVVHDLIDDKEIEADADSPSNES